MEKNFVNEIEETLLEIDLYNFSIQESFKNNILSVLKIENSLKRKRKKFEYDQTFILKEWLFENRSHPYPTDNDKLNFVLETGLSKNQIDVCK